LSNAVRTLLLLPQTVPARIKAVVFQRCSADIARGGCVRDELGDYDCAGGCGNGPNYVRGPVRVVSPDVFDLDQDRDGIACE
jgi:hypothetical protein